LKTQSDLECETLDTRSPEAKSGISSTDPDELIRSGLYLRHHLWRPDDVDRICSQEHKPGGLVAGFIARRSVSVLIGDSGLGKSPLAYQLGLCVAAGVPFLGLKTEPGLVIYADYENGLEEGRNLRNQLTRFLGLQRPPAEFVVWNPDFGNPLRLDAICEDLKPALFIIDSLRSHNPAFEKTDNAGQFMSDLRTVAYTHGVSMLVIHHVRKPGKDGVPSLDQEDTVLMEWLNQASGHRSIINQSDTRIATGMPKRSPDAAMVLRWHRRMKGEAGPIFLARVLDDEGGELGYKPMTGPELIGNADHRAAYLKLPAKFSFKDAKRICERSDDPTRKFLLKCESAGLVMQTGRGLYECLPLGTPPPSKTIEQIEEVDETDYSPSSVLAGA
jgi:hypothetical protein